MIAIEAIAVRLLVIAIAFGSIAVPSNVAGESERRTAAAQHAAGSSLFVGSERCIACHSGLKTMAGRDISIGYQWRASMMANAARDPYWHAAVRREVLDHPSQRRVIEDKCTTCHMPMGRTLAVHLGASGELLKYLAAPKVNDALTHLAFDGVSCALCHQIDPENQGKPESFDGGFVIDTNATSEPRKIFGPYEIDAGRQRVMRSSSTFEPATSTHLRESEFCASCHTLYTQPLGDSNSGAEKFPEQVPYREWLHSSYRESKSCQNCHMPQVEEETAISSVLGQPRTGVRQHTFIGGNAFMIRLLNKYRGELGVIALPQELEAAARDTEEFLRTQAARLSIEPHDGGTPDLEFIVGVRNLSGQKLPTAYPSRRVWLHITVRDAAGNTVFESGAMRPDGSIVGNDNDLDGTRFEPHYAQIAKLDQVQIYESIIVDRSSQLTTGLLSAARYIKDNRLLPNGFDKARADQDIAVRGDAVSDADFVAGADNLRVRIATGKAAPPFTVSAELLFQTVAYRWARNLAGYDSEETQRFVGYYEATAKGSASRLASASLVLRSVP